MHVCGGGEEEEEEAGGRSNIFIKQKIEVMVLLRIKYVKTLPVAELVITSTR